MSDPSKPVFKIFPPIAAARVGNAPGKFYIGPETYRGLPTNPDGTPFTDADFRDSKGALCRQAALFHVYRFENGAWTEVTLETPGVTKITWTAHIANKKASWYDFLTSLGEDGYRGLRRTVDGLPNDLVSIGDAKRGVAGAGQLAGGVDQLLQDLVDGQVGGHAQDGVAHGLQHRVQSLLAHLVLKIDRYARALCPVIGCGCRLQSSCSCCR